MVFWRVLGERCQCRDNAQRPGSHCSTIVRIAPEGWAYLLTDSPQGKLQRLVRDEDS
ncbi:MAG: hypothetical protein ACK40S_00735 [Burkholderiaceae bacterium]